MAYSIYVIPYLGDFKIRANTGFSSEFMHYCKICSIFIEDCYLRTVYDPELIVE